MNNIVPVILCGGSGKRLWPFSREGFPKQFIQFIGEKTLFQETIGRIKYSLKDYCISEILIVTNEEHRFHVLDQLDTIDNEIPVRIIVEPQPKNTAPALIMAAIKSLENTENPTLVVTPSDQAVLNKEEFKKSLINAIKEAEIDSIVTLGIQPSRPETGYGYIKYSENNANDILEFKEKPDIITARKYIDEGCYFWNSGIFVLKAELCCKAFSHFANDLFNETKKSIVNSIEDNLFIWPNKEHFNKIKPDSIDYAIMEKSPKSDFNAKTVKLDADWSDLGLWSSVWELNKDNKMDNNAVNGDVIYHNSSNNIIYSSKRLVTSIGMHNSIIIETSDAVLVADMKESSNIKHLTNIIESRGRTESSLHSKVFRPWGWYDSLENGEGFQVKRINVKPGAKLSLQSHRFRSEHWTCIKGEGEVTVNENITNLKLNESIFIPVGSTHRLCNLTDDELEIIEVQIGEYLGEDDIQRYDDTYGRISD
jgi:mannose-1-phosphate guanylyltransferase / mannose-6-phosphate isomerase